MGLNVSCIVIWQHAYGSQEIESGILNENDFHRIMHLDACSPVWNSSGRIRRSYLIGGGVTLDMSFEVSKAHIILN